MFIYMIHIRHQQLHTLQLSATPLRKAKYPKLLRCYQIISGCWLRLEKASFSLKSRGNVFIMSPISR